MCHQGVYFLADDGVFDLAVAFLNSLRQHNPTIRVILVPFSHNVARLASLATAYNVSVYQGDARLRECDSLSVRLHGRRIGHYRKLALWDGPLDEFVYIDVDTVVLGPLEPVLALLSTFDVVTSHSHLLDNLRWVWRDSIWDANVLSSPQIAYATNTGFIVSRRGVSLWPADIERVVHEVRAHIVPECQEQSFLNYLIVTSVARYSSVLVLALSMEQASVRHPLRREFWAGRKGATVVGGTLSVPGESAAPLLVHWAGEWQPRRWERVCRSVLRAMGWGASRLPCTRWRMPYRSLWAHYRWQPVPAPSNGVHDSTLVGS